MTPRALSVVLWFAAFAVTVVLAVFQRTTGPSYPLRGEVAVPGGAVVDHSLPRSHGGPGGLAVDIEVPSAITGGRLEWRRFPTDEAWRAIALSRQDGVRLGAEVPHQPPAGKVEYRLVLDVGDGTIVVPSGEPAVARFRGEVPAGALIPHILAMFASMLVATRALLEALRRSTPDPRRLVVVAMILLVLGGLLLGPVVQKFAFGEFWTGWPLGHDLTDNKTLLAVIAWLPATVLALRRGRTTIAVVVGWLVMMGIFMIPHSLRGSERDWSEGTIKTGRSISVDRAASRS
jgi:hypothetical protein